MAKDLVLFGNGREDASLEARILDYVAARQGVVTMKEIEKEVRGKNQKKLRVLNDLVQQGRLVKEGSGRKGDQTVFGIPSTESEYRSKDQDVQENTPYNVIPIPAQDKHIQCISGKSARDGDRVYLCSGNVRVAFNEKDFNELVSVFSMLNNWKNRHLAEG